MSSETEIVAAAHAVRSWVLAQRATWAGDDAPIVETLPRVDADALDLATIASLEELVPPLETPFDAPLPPLDASVPSVDAPFPPMDAPRPSIESLTPFDLAAADLFGEDTAGDAGVHGGPLDVAVPVDEPEDAEPVAAEPLPDLAPLLEMAAPTTSVYIESPRPFVSLTTIARAAAALAAAGIVAGGGYTAWQRYASAPRIGTAVIDSTPAGAAVIVDGTAAGATPLRLDLPAGAHNVELLLRGASRKQAITIVRGRETPVSVDWSAKPTGGLQVSSEPAGARVLIDGRERGVTPLELSDLPIGEHTVTIESAEGSVSRTVRIGTGRTESIAESIFPGWISVSAPFDVTVSEGSQGIQLDSSSRALLKPGRHTLRFQNRAYGFTDSRQIVVEPGATTEVSIASPTSALTVTGPAGADVFIDGEKVGRIPLASFPVKVGTRDVMVVEQSGATHHRSLTITAAPATLAIGPE